MLVRVGLLMLNGEMTQPGTMLTSKVADAIKKLVSHALRLGSAMVTGKVSNAITQLASHAARLVRAFARKVVVWILAEALVVKVLSTIR